MPEAFNKCVRNGGRVFTKTLVKGRYVHGCEKNGKTVWGEIKKKKDKQNKK